MDNPMFSPAFVTDHLDAAAEAPSSGSTHVENVVAQAIAAGVPLIHLLSFGIYSLKWLCDLTVPVGLCWRDDQGEIRTEVLGPLGFIVRTHEIGFVPKPGDEDDNCVTFEDFYWWWDDDTQVQWYSVRGCASENGIPLTFTAAIEADEQETRDFQRRIEEERLEKEREKAEAAAALPGLLRKATKQMVDEEMQRGVCRTRRQARDRVRRLLNRQTAIFLRNGGDYLMARAAAIQLNWTLRDMLKDSPKQKRGTRKARA